MEAKIKICGLKSLKDISYANRCRPDYVGFVFAKSSRQVTKELASDMRSHLDDGIPAVGVFVKERIPFISSLCKDKIIQMVQLHGEEDISYIEELKQEIDVPIIRAIRVKDRESIEKEEKLPVDYFLFDTYVKGQYGGSGIPFDISRIPSGWKRPYFLAGGLNAENLPTLLKGCSPYGVDVSSGVETGGRKDYDKMMKIIELLRF